MNSILKSKHKGRPCLCCFALVETVFCSLGMTILELASDLDLPRGGEGWHMLRSGQLPEEFLRGKYRCMFFYWHVWYVYVHDY